MRLCKVKKKKNTTLLLILKLKAEEEKIGFYKILQSHETNQACLEVENCSKHHNLIEICMTAKHTQTICENLGQCGKSRKASRIIIACIR